MLTIIHGKDTLRSRFALRELIAKEGVVAEVLEDASAFEEIRVRLENTPLFAGQSLLVLEDGITGECGAKLVSYSRLSDLARAPHVRLVLYESGDVSPRVAYKALAPHAEVSVFTLLSSAGAVEWLAAAHKKSKAITPAIVRLVFARVGSDMWSAHQELAKLSAYCGDTPAKEEDLDTLDIGVQTANIFATIDGVFSGSASSSFERLQVLWQEGQSPLGVFALMERQLRVIALTKEADARGAASGVIAKTAGIPPFAVSKAVATSRRMSWAKIKGLYARVESLDEKMKRGAIDPYFAVELLAVAVLAPLEARHK
jgi:DNA polymerase-3 subunit delta